MTTARVYLGDCRAVLIHFGNNSIDAVVTDPPYELGFLGHAWDNTGIAFDSTLWAEVRRVLKPGAFLLAFGGTRTFHRIAVAIENAGFEIRDTIAWLFGQGMPKSKAQLKPAFEPIIMARNPIGGSLAANVSTYGTGLLGIDQCRIANELGTSDPNWRRAGRADAVGLGYGKRGSRTETGESLSPLGRWPSNVVHDGSDIMDEFFKAQDDSSISRFFYCAKATKKERADSQHPTVKPQKLMRYLCKLVTPLGGVVLDPFAGSGSTLQAARDEGFRSIGMEQSATYVADIARRLEVAR